MTEQLRGLLRLRKRLTKMGLVDGSICSRCQNSNETFFHVMRDTVSPFGFWRSFPELWWLLS
jgi:hypothetical protein